MGEMCDFEAEFYPENWPSCFKPKSNFVDWNDKTIPLGKRKTAYVKWLIGTKKLTRDAAKLACYKKFRKEEDTYTKAGHALWKKQDREEINNG